MEEVEMKEKLFVSTDNIFADLDLKNAEELKTRSDLMSEVVTIIQKSGFSQKEITKILGITAPKVSALMTGKINDFSNDTLLRYLMLLGCNVEIRVVARHRVSRLMKRGKVTVKKPLIRRKAKRLSKNHSHL